MRSSATDSVASSRPLTWVSSRCPRSVSNSRATLVCRIAAPVHEHLMDMCCIRGVQQLFAESAIAEHLRQKYAKVAIVDTDMHHGQGIQEIFYERSDVLYTSVHGDPVNFYPAVTGHEFERGTGAGEGYNVNFPMPHGTDEAGFFNYVDKSIEAMTLFDPDVIVHVLGFDVYKDDPEARCAVTTEGFTVLAQKLKALNKPLIVLVEGGYYLQKLNDNLQAFLSGLISED